MGGFTDGFVDDDGTAPESVRRALAKAEEMPILQTYLEAVVELCLSRLLVPLVAAGDETMEQDPERQASMSAVLLQTEDGRRAQLVFTGVDSLGEWNAAARPVPATLDVVAGAAVQAEAGTILVDFMGPHPLVIDGEVLEHLSHGRRLIRTEDGNYGWLAPSQTHDDEQETQ